MKDTEIHAHVKLPTPLGRFGLRTIKDGKVNKIHGPGCNMILDNFWTDFFQTNGASNNDLKSWFSHVRVGTGSSAILPGTTALNNIHPATQNSSTITVRRTAVEINEIRYRPIDLSWTFGHGAIDAILTEIALYSTSSLSNIRAATLLKDDQGAPAAFPVNGDEQLIVDYTIYWPCVEGEPEELPSSNISHPWRDAPVAVTLTIDGQPHTGNLYFRSVGWRASLEQYCISGNTDDRTVTARTSFDSIGNDSDWNELSTTDSMGTSVSSTVSGRQVTYVTKTVIVGSVGTINIKQIALGPWLSSSSTTRVVRPYIALFELDEVFTRPQGTTLEINLNFILDWSIP